MTRPHDRARRAFAQAQRLMPGGVSSPVRSFKAVVGEPVVIAYGQGGALETILPFDPATPRTSGPTGVFFDEQSVGAVVAAIERFETNSDRFDPKALREHALGFDRQVFRDRIETFVAARWATHVNGQGPSDAAKA
jgi:hypothetical protein